MEGIEKMAGASHAEELSNGFTEEEQNVRTLFVSGLPMDTTKRELYLLCRSYEGYERCHLMPTGKKGKPTSPVGFVTFSTRSAAEHAMNELQGVQFDPDSLQKLRLEFARSNTKVSSPKQPNLVQSINSRNDVLSGTYFLGRPDLWAAPAVISTFPEPLCAAATTSLNCSQLLQNQLLLHVPHQFQPTLVTSLSSLMNGTAAAAAAAIAPTPAAPMPALTLTSSPLVGAEMPLGGSKSNSTATPASINSPCSTLFVANLGPLCTEQELRDVFLRFPGFCRLQINSKGGFPVAFVEFQGSDESVRYHPYRKENNHDYKGIRYATHAMNMLQGAMLHSSIKGGIRIEYAKSRMGDSASATSSCKMNANSSIPP